MHCTSAVQAEHYYMKSVIYTTFIAVTATQNFSSSVNMDTVKPLMKRDAYTECPDAFKEESYSLTSIYEKL